MSFTREIRSRWMRVSQRLSRVSQAHGLSAMVSECLFFAAHLTARGEQNTVYRDPLVDRKRVTEKEEKLRFKLETTREQRREVASQLRKIRREAAQSKKAAERSSKRLSQLARKVERSHQKGDLAFHPTTGLAEQACASCGRPSDYVSTYPYPWSHRFSKMLVCWCSKCEFGWVPAVPFALSDYYEKLYAKDNRGDRQRPPEEYFKTLSDPQSEGHSEYLKYTKRVREQLSKIEHYTPENYSLLDYGSGPGYALYMADASSKHAIDLDKESEKYLNYIGASLLRLDDLEPETYDVILASHSIEHLEYRDLNSVLAQLRRSLKPEGVLYIEVPNGSLLSSQLIRRHEPHTLFFSLKSLRKVAENAGLEVLESFVRCTCAGIPLSEPLAEKQEEQPANADGLTIICRPSGQPHTSASIPPLELKIAKVDESAGS